MTARSAATSPYNHLGCPGCDGTRPLTLADREMITGRAILTHDDTGSSYCGDCLADLPDGPEALAHVCGEATPTVGDVVRYHGSLTDYHGVWEVTHIDGRGLVLFDVDRALWNVSPGSVTVIGHKRGNPR